jgi:anti-sigma B factor antagonist
MPSSKASFRQVGAVTVVDLSGIFMLGESSAVFRKAILDLISKQRNKIVLNFREVTSIDSAGVGELVAAYVEIKRIQGRVRLLNPPKKICDMLELTQLSKVFQVYGDEPAALRSFD